MQVYFLFCIFVGWVEEQNPTQIRAYPETQFLFLKGETRFLPISKPGLSHNTFANLSAINTIDKRKRQCRFPTHYTCRETAVPFP
jgi:hypothetical protein